MAGPWARAAEAGRSQIESPGRSCQGGSGQPAVHGSARGHPGAPGLQAGRRLYAGHPGHHALRRGDVVTTPELGELNLALPWAQWWHTVEKGWTTRISQIEKPRL